MEEGKKTQPRKAFLFHLLRHDREGDSDNIADGAIKKATAAGLCRSHNF